MGIRKNLQWKYFSIFFLENVPSRGKMLPQFYNTWTICTSDTYTIQYMHSTLSQKHTTFGSKIQKVPIMTWYRYTEREVCNIFICILYSILIFYSLSYYFTLPKDYCQASCIIMCCENWAYTIIHLLSGGWVGDLYRINYEMHKTICTPPPANGG